MRVGPVTGLVERGAWHVGQTTLWTLHQHAAAAHRLAAPPVARADLDVAITFLVELDRLLERAVDADGGLLAVDVEPGVGRAPPGDDEDITVGFDVHEIQLGRGVGMVAGALARGDAEPARPAPGTLGAFAAEGGDPPEEGPLAAQAP